MRKEMVIAYWSAEEPTDPNHSPTLAQAPDTIDLVILYSVQIKDGGLDVGPMVQKNDQATIMGWMAEVRERQKNQPRKTKFSLCIVGEDFASQDPEKFAEAVKAAVESWGVDGIDIDYEYPGSSPSIIPVVQAIRHAMPAGSLLTTPIYFPWVQDPQVAPLLAPYTALFDYVMTMDYTPYGSYGDTIDLYEQYAKVMGGDAAAYGKLAIGVSCMEFQEPDEGNHTPLDDVKKLCIYEPPLKGASKLGVMLYTLSYDAPGHGSPYPLFAYTKAIAESLP